jgi:hypothetical protein
MSTKVVVEQDPNGEEVQQLRNKYVSIIPDSIAFAVAMQRVTGWPMFLAHNIPRTWAPHALVQDPDGRFWDTRGPLERDSIGTHFGYSGPLPSEPVPTSVKDLMKNSETMKEPEIARAIEAIDFLFPDLTAGTPHSRREMLQRVGDEYENASRASGFWIMQTRTMVDGNVIDVIELQKAWGDEEGYTIKYSLFGRISIEVRRRVHHH